MLSINLKQALKQSEAFFMKGVFTVYRTVSYTWIADVMLHVCVLDRCYPGCTCPSATSWRNWRPYCLPISSNSCHESEPLPHLTCTPACSHGEHDHRAAGCTPSPQPRSQTTSFKLFTLLGLECALQRGVKFPSLSPCCAIILRFISLLRPFPSSDVNFFFAIVKSLLFSG